MLLSLNLFYNLLLLLLSISILETSEIGHIIFWIREKELWRKCLNMMVKQEGVRKDRKMIRNLLKNFCFERFKALEASEPVITKIRRLYRNTNSCNSGNDLFRVWTHLFLKPQWKMLFPVFQAPTIIPLQNR